MKGFIGIALLAVACAAAIWLGVANRGLRQTAERLETELRAEREKARAGAAPQHAPSAPVPQAPSSTARAPQVLESTANPEAELLRARLVESRNMLDSLTAQMNQLRSQVKQLQDERSRAANEESRMRTQIAELDKTTADLAAERSTLAKRVNDLAAANATLQRAQSESQQRTQQLSRVASDLEDVSRRQQVYITNILRRYREVTELFRAFPAVVENRGNGPEISRIQSALQMADEDIRQLNDLSARLSRVQRQLTTAVAVK